MAPSLGCLQGVDGCPRNTVVNKMEHPGFHCCSIPSGHMETSHIITLEILTSAPFIQAAFPSLVLLLDSLYRSAVSWCIDANLETEDLGSSLSKSLGCSVSSDVKWK